MGVLALKGVGRRDAEQSEELGGAGKWGKDLGFAVMLPFTTPTGWDWEEAI